MGNTVSQHIVPTTPLAIGTTGDFTFGAWVRLNRKTVSGNNDSHTLMVANFNYSNNLGYLFQVEPILGRINIFTGNTIYASGNNVVVYNKWNYIVYELVGTTANVYVNDMVTPAYTVSIVRKADSTLVNRFGSEDVGTGAAVRRLYGSLGSHFAANRVLTSIEKAALMNGTSVPSGLGVYYKLDEGAGTTATDSSGNNNSGTITNGTWSTDTPSKLRTAATNRVAVQDIKSSLFFNATGGVTVPSSGTTSVIGNATNTNYSWGCRAKLSPKNAAATAFFAKASTKYPLQLRIEANGKVRAAMYDGSMNPVAQSANTYTDSQWHTFVGVRAGSSIKLYIDGALVASTTTAIGDTSEASNIVIGGNTTFGNVSGAFITLNALTADEILRHHQTGILPYPCVVNLPFDEGAGAVAYDTSGNGNHGTITSATYTSDVPTKKRGVVGGNLVKNGDFEYAPPTNVAMTSGFKWLDGTATGSNTNYLFGWAMPSYGGSYAAKFDNTEKYNGKYSLKLSTTAISSYVRVNTNLSTAASHALNNIPCLPNTSYTLSFVMKTSLISGSAATGAYASIIQKIGDGVTGAAASVSGGSVTASADWTRYTVTATTSSTARFLAVEVGITGQDGTGTLIMDAWFDDITLTPTAPVTRGVVS
jgi:hypothetical protein